MLIYGAFFAISILAILLDLTSIAIVCNLLGLLLVLAHFLRKKDIDKDAYLIESTKNALCNLKEKKFQDINFKALKKDNNPYISELKALSEAMQKQQNRIQKRTRKLHEKNLQTTQLLASISHEIKNPLSIIQASIETIMIHKEMEEDMRNKLLHRIMIYSKKINALLNKLTLSESLEHNVIAIKMEQFDILLLCEEVIEGFHNYLLKAVYQDKKIVLEGKNRLIFADRILIEQVLNNLIYNALKYANTKVIVQIHDGYIAVIDDGLGVAKNELANLTKKYYQGSNTKQGSHSLGLGLFIVKEIAKIHNTKVEFFTKRTKKEGLCVCFRI